MGPFVTTIDGKMKAMDFKQISVKHCLYMCTTKAGTLIAAVHVNDFTCMSSSYKEESHFEQEMCRHWKITKSEATFIVRIAIKWDRAKCTISLSQNTLIDFILTEFNCKDINLTVTPLAPGMKLSKSDCPQTKEKQ